MRDRQQIRQLAAELAEAAIDKLADDRGRNLGLALTDAFDHVTVDDVDALRAELRTIAEQVARHG